MSSDEFAPGWLIFFIGDFYIYYTTQLYGDCYGIIMSQCKDPYTPSSFEWFNITAQICVLQVVYLVVSNMSTVYFSMFILRF